MGCIVSRRSVTVLGSTGSIGRATLDVLDHTGDAHTIEALVAGRDVATLALQAKRLRPKLAVVADPAGYQDLKSLLANTGIEIAAGDDAVVEAAARPADWVMAAIVGTAGLKPALKAVQRGATLALANKESLVTAGHLFMHAAEQGGATIIPVDSEHNAIFQALNHGTCAPVRRLILTASGGPFRTWTRERMAQATPEQAVAHPNWSMGAKISVDSATMMNKGLELIEASVLFDIDASRIDVLVHPQSIVHAMVEYVDGSTLAQMSPPDMRTPIACAWAWPNRLAWPAPQLDLTAIGSLTFEAPDETRFPLLSLARAAARQGGIAPAVMNAANEIAVAAFLGNQIGFLGIAHTVGDVVERMGRAFGAEAPDLDTLLAIDHETRVMTANLLARGGQYRS
jgi:1-deoxy-D-xylulose-5-phosphate reductoisomerase